MSTKTPAETIRAIGNLITIDPGYATQGDGCACAAFVDYKLNVVWFARPTVDAALACPYRSDHRLAAVVYEKPQHRAQDPSFANIPVNTLIELGCQGAMLSGLYAARYATDGARCGVLPYIIDVIPRAWKGTVAKPAHHAKLWKTLQPPEQSLLGGDKTWREIDAACERGALDKWRRPGVAYYRRGFATHNILDAVGLGLVTLERL